MLHKNLLAFAKCRLIYAFVYYLFVYMYFVSGTKSAI